jgi:type IV pilus biogenesis protein CpaD/CtpE
MKNYLLLLAVAATVSLASCGKDDDEATTPAQTKTDLISNKNWTITAETISAMGQSEDLYADYKACEKDNFVKFATDGKVTFDEGATKCASTDPQTETYNWSFSNNEGTLVISNGSQSIDQNISELTASKMVLTMSDSDTINNIPITITYSTTYEVK